MEKNGEVSTLDRILQIAKVEFLKNGYEGVGLRQIVRDAGVTTGAFYGYFKTKEELFSALVDEPYEGLIEMYRKILSEFSQIPDDKKQSDMMNYTYAGVDSMLNYVYNFYDEFKLILCCSKGTKYEDLVHTLVNLDERATYDFVDVSKKLGKEVKNISPFLMHILTSGMFSAFFEFIIHGVEIEEAIRLSHQIMEFYNAGWFKIMGI